MDKVRKQYTNEITIILTRLRKSKQREEDTLKNLRNLKISQEIFQIKEKQLRESIDKIEKEIEEQEKKSIEYLEGRLDDDIEKIYDKNKESVRVKNNKKATDIIEKPEKKIKTKQIKSNFETNYKDFKYFYKQHCKAVETIPDYMLKNLSDMPNNKGYIWRSCWFFGQKRSETNQPVIMFEKKQGGILYIHEIDSCCHKIFEKIGDGKKKLIQKKPRIKL